MSIETGFSCIPPTKASNGWGQGGAYSKAVVGVGGGGGSLFKILALSVGTYYSKKYDVYHYKIVQIQTAKS